jgi:transposase
MDIHKNARLTPKGREEMVRGVVEGGLSKAVAARKFNTSGKTVKKWVERFRYEGVNGLHDRSSRPLSSPSQTPQATCDAVEALRRQRRTQQHIADDLAISKASVSRILKHRGLSRLSSLEPQQPRPRYDREKPGEIIHLDIKKLGRFNSAGHRITVIATVAYFKTLGITVERVMTDNGGCYISRYFKRACEQLGIKHIRIKPYTPQTNGKAERFIQTALREWAYATAFEHSEQRRSALPAWLHRYNWHRPHGSLGRKPPITRLGLTGNNLLSLHS